MANMIAENYKSNFSTTVRLDDVRIDMRTNGPHRTIVPNSHDHTGYEVQAALMGEYHIEFEHKTLVMKAPDTVCLIPPGCRHRSRYAGPGVRQMGLGLRFNWRHKPGQGEDSGLLEALERLPRNEPVLLTDAGELCDTLRRFSEELAAPDVGSEVLLDALLRQFYIQLFRALKAAAGPRARDRSDHDKREDRYGRIEEFFHEHYADHAVTEEDLAEYLSVSKRQTSRILRRLCGKSFHEKLEEIRMHYALQWLVHTDERVEDIALQVGYTAASGFYVAFKKAFGVTPARYRRDCTARHGKDG
ncbi:MAG: helix-turn-helix transcriptional regulator [Oscillospiraceae bacterium]|nr:helix-turn-helix transcriptional regulator [Oscillospiraceae bacterium]